MNASQQALAIKYRPRRFEDLIGQDTVSQTLSLALDADRLSHAYLFSGLRGSGKTSSARIFAKALNCVSGPTSAPCEKCENCEMANTNRHIDIIEMDAASSRKIDDIRDVIEQTKYKPSVGRFKIFIIDEVHMLTREAFNALLKTLEEPPGYVKFILATTDPMKLPATILSRTQHFRFKKINRKDVLHHLEHVLNCENIAYEPEALEMLARSGGGSLRDTLTLLDQAIIYSKGEVDAISVSDMLGIIDPEFIERIFDAVFEKDDKKIRAIATELEDYEIDSVLDELIAATKERMGEDVRFSALICDRFFRIFSESKGLLAINCDSGFVITLCFFKMLEALKIKEIDSLIAELEGERPDASAVVKPSRTSSVETPTPAPAFDPTRNRYESLIAKLLDRSDKLGTCFREHIAFVTYEDDALTLKSKAEDNCKEVLRRGSGVIKNFVWELYGVGTKIVIVPWEEEEKPPTVSSEEASAEESSSALEVPEAAPEAEAPPPQITEEDPGQSGSSCVQAVTAGQGSAQELDRDQILNHPTIQKARELFDPEKITVQSKV